MAYGRLLRMEGAMKKTVRLMLILSFFLLIVPLPIAQASWFIDSNRFLHSIHGANSCTECHEAVSDADLHPNPEDVYKQLSDFFDPDEQCLKCHEEVSETLQEGTHGSESVDDPSTYENCIECHDPHYEEPLGTEEALPELANVPALSEEDAECMVCHGILDISHGQDINKFNQICLDCHGDSGTPAQKQTAESIPLIRVEEYETVAHSQNACVDCHLKATRFPHTEKELSSCTECHPRHDEKVANSAHFTVSCEACHLSYVTPVKDPRSQKIIWEPLRNLEAGLNIHQMAQADDNEACQSCHHLENQIGAAAMVLPAKGLLCMPCHAGTFSIGDTTTILSLAVFLMGMIMMFSYLLTGTLSKSTEEAEENVFHKFFILVGNAFCSIFSGKIVPIIKALILDVLFQRRLYLQSRKRWLIHGLIFYPFAFRFFWGMTALLGSLWFPNESTVWTMLDKNHPATALLFDVSGIMIMIGLAAAFMRSRQPEDTRIPGLPRQDRVALALIAGIVLVGFVLEGMRITMTGSPAGAAAAFIGYGLSKIFSSGPGLNQWYGYIWYLHAILTGAFIAYLPFSRLAHIIMAPINLAMNAVAEDEHEVVN